MTRIDQAVEEREARTSAILDAAADAIITIDQDGVIESVNSVAERLFGYAAAELLGRNVKQLLPSPYYDEDDGYLRNCVVTKENKAIGVGRDMAGRRKDGRVFPMHLSVSELHLGDRRLFTCIARDITTLTQAIRRLEESEARNSAILKTAPHAIITIDDRGAIEAMNPAAERIFGYSAAEVVGRNIKMLMPSPYHEEHDAYLQNYMTTGRKKIIGIGREVVGRRKNGETFPMDLAVSEVFLGERRLFTGIVQDISERKESEEQLRYFAAELQNRNAQLVRSNQELDDFAYVASHDLKEPLRGIHNYATFLIEDYGDKLDEEGCAKLTTLKTLTQRMDGLLDSLLEFSRVGQVDFAYCDTDLNEVLAEVLHSLHITIQQRGLQIRVPRRLPTVRCDSVRIGEVFGNLITNAMKYNDKDLCWIEIGYVNRAEQPGLPAETGAKQVSRPLLFYVRDNGIGIAEKQLTSIFRIFRRLHARSKFGGGVGVGLTIVKKIVERHGGRIWAESALGSGTTFHFTLAPEGLDPC